jgi:chromate transporter
MIAYIRKMAVDQMGWLDDKAFRSGVALCQVIPGATAMQMAAYVGLRTRGVAGAAITYIGFGLPAFLMMMLLSAIYQQTHSMPAVASIFGGLAAIIVAIVAYAAFSFGNSYLKRWQDIAMAAFAAGMLIMEISPFIVIILAAFLGLALSREELMARGQAYPESAPRTARHLLIISSTAAIGFILLYYLEHDLFDLAEAMFRIDLFAFGGGLASLPLMLNEVVRVRSWMDYQTFMNGIALGQVTPGPIVITAAFVGYMVHGPVGGIVATIGVFLPSFLILIGTVPYYDRLGRSARFNRAVHGILCSFVGLLASVAYYFASNMPGDPAHAIMAASAFIALYSGIDILWVILAGALVSAFIL